MKIIGLIWSTFSLQYHDILQYYNQLLLFIIIINTIIIHTTTLLLIIIINTFLKNQSNNNNDALLFIFDKLPEIQHYYLFTTYTASWLLDVISYLISVSKFNQQNETSINSQERQLGHLKWSTHWACWHYPLQITEKRPENKHWACKQQQMQRKQLSDPA